MYLKKLKVSTDPCLRSLLQKAVRSIVGLGDLAWLRSRTVVITFEESWPFAQSFVFIGDQQSKVAVLLRVSLATKQKDAAGLGALAFAFHEGDHSMLDLVPSEQTLRIVSGALDRRNAYFDWVLAKCSSAESRSVVVTAREYLAAATWGWDKATILAAAFLAASGGVPTLPASAPAGSDFPYWVALDKHTPEGKEALRRVGSNCRIAYRQLIWAGFYCESTIVNAMDPSVWFEVERSWRLRKVGLSMESATELWNSVRPTLIAELSAKAEGLRAQVEGSIVSQGDLFT